MAEVWGAIEVSGGDLKTVGPLLQKGPHLHRGLWRMGWGSCRLAERCDGGWVCKGRTQDRMKEIHGVPPHGDLSPQ